MKNKLTFLFAFIVLATMAGNNPKSVQKHVVGKVVDQITGEPLTGVLIHETTTGEKIYTDVNGAFDVSFYDNESHSLEITYISYEDKKLVISAESKTEEVVTIYLSESYL